MVYDPSSLLNTPIGVERSDGKVLTGIFLGMAGDYFVLGDTNGSGELFIHDRFVVSFFPLPDEAEAN